MALTETLSPTLHCFEIALRNALSDAAAMHFPTSPWFDYQLPNGTPLLNTWARGEVTRAEATLRTRGKPITTGGIVAGLTLGFWVSLAGNAYNGTLWPHMCARGFRTHRCHGFGNRGGYTYSLTPGSALPDCGGH